MVHFGSFIVRDGSSQAQRQGVAFFTSRAGLLYFISKQSATSFYCFVYDFMASFSNGDMLNPSASQAVSYWNTQRRLSGVKARVPTIWSWNFTMSCSIMAMCVFCRLFSFLCYGVFVSILPLWKILARRRFLSVLQDSSKPRQEPASFSKKSGPFAQISLYWPRLHRICRPFRCGLCLFLFDGCGNRRRFSWHHLVAMAMYNGLIQIKYYCCPIKIFETM